MPRHTLWAIRVLNPFHLLFDFVPVAPLVGLFEGKAKSSAELLLLAKDEMNNRGISDWKSISMQVAATPGLPASFRIDRSIGGQPSTLYNLQLDGVDGSVAARCIAGDGYHAVARSQYGDPNDVRLDRDW